MPIYLYVCPVHGEFEKLHTKIDERPETCPKCEAKSKRSQTITAAARRNPNYGIQR